jgi:anti-sigma factor RsiW
MGCAEELRVHALVDGEVDALVAADIEKHLGQCPECRTLREDLEHMRTALQQDVAHEQAPPSLRARIARALDQEAGARSVATKRRHAWVWWRGPIAWSALSGLGGAALATAFAFLFLLPMRGNTVVDDVVTAHVRSISSSHLIDVESSEHHTVKPWFAGRADVSPTVEDFSAQGYKLVGGRADYLNHQRSAVLIYKHGPHVINVFSWAADGGRLPATAVRDGYHVNCWTSGTVQYCAISDTGKEELQGLVRLIQQSSAREG